MGEQGSIGPKQPNIPSVNQIATSLNKALTGKDSKGRIFMTPKGFERMNWLEAGVKWLTTGFKVHTVSATMIESAAEKLKQSGARNVNMEKINELKRDLASRSRSKKPTKSAEKMWYKVWGSITPKSVGKAQGAKFSEETLFKEAENKKIDVDHQKFSLVIKNKIRDLAKQNNIAKMVIKHGAPLIANTLNDLLQRGEDLDSVREKLIQTIRETNEQKELIDRETFVDLNEGFRETTLDLYQAPEYKEVLKSHKEDTWKEDAEKEITFTNFEPDDLKSFEKVINALFDDADVQQIIENLKSDEDIKLEHPEVGEIFTSGDEKDQSDLELLDTPNNPQEKDIDQQ